LYLKVQYKGTATMKIGYVT